MLQQLAAARFAHRHPGWHLMPGSHIVVIAGGVIKDDPLFIHRMRHDIGIGKQKSVNSLAKTGILHANARAGGHQQAGQQVQRVLRTEGNQNLVRRGDNSAFGQHPGADLLNQHRHVPIDMIHHPLRVPYAAVQPVRRRAPGRQRELAGIGLTVDKRIAVVHPAGRFENRLLLTGGNLQPRAPAWCRTRVLRCSFCYRGGSCVLIIRMQVITAARAAHQISLVNQPLKHQRRGVARYPQLAGQLAAGGERRVGGKNAAQNGVNQRFAHLLLQTAARVEINV